MSPASPKVNTLSMNAGPVTFPSARAAPMPPVTVATSLVAFFHGVSAFDSSLAAASFEGVAGGVGGGAGRGEGGMISPL